MLFELNTMEMPDHRLVNSSALLIKEEFGDHYFLKAIQRSRFSTTILWLP